MIKELRWIIHMLYTFPIRNIITMYYKYVLIKNKNWQQNLKDENSQAQATVRKNIIRKQNEIKYLVMTKGPRLLNCTKIVKTTNKQDLCFCQ